MSFSAIAEVTGEAQAKENHMATSEFIRMKQYLPNSNWQDVEINICE